jgi:hypothetical protein
MSRFTEILIVSPLADGQRWYLQKEFGYDVGREGSGETIDVPIGFLTDFASVPRPLWWLFPRWGKYGNAAVIHDFCYWEQKYSRKRADEILLEAMVVLEVGPVTRYIMYLAVWLFGWIAWWNNGRLKRSGETKIAKRPPVKSTETRDDLMSD